MSFCIETNSFLAFSLFSHRLPTTGKESNSKENDNLGTMQVSTIFKRENKMLEHLFEDLVYYILQSILRTVYQIDVEKVAAIFLGATK